VKTFVRLVRFSLTIHHSINVQYYFSPRLRWIICPISQYIITTSVFSWGLTWHKINRFNFIFFLDLFCTQMSKISFTLG
jgi:hypothetical protein